ncbi:MAG TPA: DNA gyrase subunit A [Candidatus Dojkabacteria bacterium]|nr:DNA gyrase subunit A [Candidatus Dojkabacteria bacterium]
MEKIIPIYYSDYGRYINRFRAIPSYIDGLKIVERRLLLTLHEVAKNDLVKSARVIGTALAKYHPHGDVSLYGTLVNLVDQGYAIGQGNWGSPGLNDDEAAAYRYSEIKLEKWVEELAFKYIDYVPYEEFELDPEPIYLPCPLPIGLIGHGVIIGISFYRTLIPKFKISDLAKRLVYLLEKKKAPNIEIFPNFKDCDIYELEPNQMNSILTNGTGTLNIVPHGDLESKCIRIRGRAPNASFASLQKDADKLEINLLDESSSTINIVVEPKKRGVDLQTLGQKIWDEYLIKNLNFNNIFCDNDGRVKTYGIDEILTNNYTCWEYAVKLKFIDDYNKLSNKKVELMIVQIIRYIFETYKSNKVEEIVSKYQELKKTHDIRIEIDIFNIDNNTWSKEIRTIEDKDIIDVCNKRSIKNLIETVIDIQKVESDLLSAKSSIDNCEINCFNFVKQLI